MPEAIDRPPEAPWDRRFAWRMGCWAFAVLTIYCTTWAWVDWDPEAAAFVADLAWSNPAVLLHLFPDPGAWWVTVYPLGAVLGLLGLITCLCHAWGER
jgi:hypothetical protein